MSYDPDEGLSRRSILRSLGVAGLAGAAGTAAGRHGGPHGKPRAGNGRNGGEDGCGDGTATSPPPGPSVLYDSPADASQFKNRDKGPWSAEPLLVCGADAYVEGEYLFQDFIYDDYGANTSPGNEPPDPKPAHHDFGPMTGDIVYPSAPETYASNAADLLEFRCRLTEDGGIEYRITMNTMLEGAEDAAIVAVGIDTGSGVTRTDWGHGLGELGAPVDHVLFVAGEKAELVGPDGKVQSVNPTADSGRNQIEVTVPLSPDADESWTHYCVTGIHDGGLGFRQIANQPSEDQPGGARGQSPPPVFNVGFRYAEEEPFATPNVDTGTAEKQAHEAVEEATGSRGIGYGHWREHAQAKALTARDISEFSAEVDFGKLEERVTDRNVPETGYLNRIYASSYELEHDGVTGGVGPYITETGDDNNGEDVLRGNLIPYALYVPESVGEEQGRGEGHEKGRGEGHEKGRGEGHEAAESEPVPFHIHLHSLSGTYNQYGSWTPNFIRELGKKKGTMILTTTGRGPGVPYDDQAELDLFEAWADVAARYNLDWDRVTLGGYSMGGIGTHRIASKWPDLFAKAFPIVGSLGDETTDTVFGDDLYKNQEQIAINQRHVPLLMWQGTTDELVPLPLVMKYEQHLRDLGIRHELDIFPGYDHLAFGYLDEWEPAVEFLKSDYLGEPTVERNPQRITYRRVPQLDNYDFDLVHDGVYWVSDITTTSDSKGGSDDRDDPDAERSAQRTAEPGLVDVRSLGFGESDPFESTFERPGTEPKPHVKRGLAWEEKLTDPGSENVLELDLTEISALTIWVDEAELDASQEILLVGNTTDPAKVTLKSTAGEATVTVKPDDSDDSYDFSKGVNLC